MKPNPLSFDGAPVVYPHIIKPEGDVARFQSTPRMRVATIVMDSLYHGMSVGEICDAYPFLSLAEAHAAMAYYYDHKEEIEREIREQEEAIARYEAEARVNPSPFALRVQAIRKALEAGRGETPA